jgi:hypothetical protein
MGQDIGNTVTAPWRAPATACHIEFHYFMHAVFNLLYFPSVTYVLNLHTNAER